MHRLAVGALGFGLLAGCLGEKTRQCDNGATCAFDEACTEVALDSGQNLCGSLTQVDACRGLPEFSACTFAEPDVPGTCLGNTCSACTPNLAGCRFPGWVAMTPVVTSKLRSVWVGGPTEAYAVGDQRTVLWYDGRRWQGSQIEDGTFTGTNPALTSVWSDGATVYAASNFDEGYVFTGQRVGGSFTWSTAMPGVVVNAISGSGPNDIIVVGTTPQVPFEGAMAEFDGTSWKPIAVGMVGPLSGVHVVDSQTAWAVGSNGLILRREAGTWSVSQMNMPGQKGLNDIWGTGGTGYAASALDTLGTRSRLLQFDTVTWSTAPLPEFPAAPLVNLTSVWGADDGVFVVGGAGALFHFNGSQWTVQTAPTGQTNLSSVDGSASDNVFYVGENGAIGRFTGEP